MPIGAATAARARMPTVPTQVMVRRRAGAASPVARLSENPPRSAIQVCHPQTTTTPTPTPRSAARPTGCCSRAAVVESCSLRRAGGVAAEQEDGGGGGHHEVEERLPGGGQAPEPAGGGVAVRTDQPDQAERREADRGSGQGDQTQRCGGHRAEGPVGVDLAAAHGVARGERRREVGQQEVEQPARDQAQSRRGPQRVAGTQPPDRPRNRHGRPLLRCPGHDDRAPHGNRGGTVAAPHRRPPRPPFPAVVTAGTVRSWPSPWLPRAPYPAPPRHR